MIKLVFAILFPFISLTGQLQDIQPNSILPDIYLGHWTGMANQNNAGSWPIELELIQGKTGEKVGIIKYPTLSCGGYLILVEIRDNGLVLKEYLNTGTFRCINKGNLYLNLHGEGLSFYWEHDIFTESWAKGSLGKEI